MSESTVLITGGARRLGAALARALSDAGYRVVIHYNNSADDAMALRDELSKDGTKAFTVQGNLTVESSAVKLAEDATTAAGPITHLINNASIFPEDRLDAITNDSVTENMNINALVPLFLGRALRERGTLTNVVNLLDTRVVDYDEKHVSYHLSKRALQSLTAMMAMEWAPAVRVNGVSPGLILPPEGKTEEYFEGLKSTNPLNTYGGPDDIVRAVLFLLDSPFITGQNIFVDGGRHLKGRFYE